MAFLVSVPLGDSLSFVFGPLVCSVCGHCCLLFDQDVVALKEVSTVFFLALSTLFEASSMC